jgi:hypothetical protein
MSRFDGIVRVIILSIFWLVILLSPLKADGFLKSEDLQSIKTICLIEDYQIGFCSESNLNGNHVILRLSEIKSVLLNQRTHAFRVSATIENMSKRIILNSKLKIMFGEDESEHLIFMIPQKIIYKDTSSSTISHLIRSDVKSISKLYEKINFIYFNADPSSIKLRPVEINFIKN